MIIGNRYQLLFESGSGQSSTVWSAKDLKVHKSDPVAVKILNVSDVAADDVRVRELFKRECESLRRLKHANLISFLDSGIDDNRLYIVTEYFSENNLRDYILQNSTDLEEILKISLQILEGIAEAHQKGVVHRDLKPKNILIDEQRRIKIIDFGISKIIGISYKNSYTLREYMTVPYAAPEQLLRAEATPASDLYSFGAVLCFMISKEDPPEDKTRINEYIERLQCFPELKEILISLLEFDATNRPHNAYLVIRQIKKIYKNIVAENKKFHLLMPNYIPRQLWEQGLISYCTFQHGKIFVTNDTFDSRIYRHRDTYYVIGKNAKYHCKLADDASFLRLYKISSMDQQTDWEREYNRGIPVNNHWTIISDNELLEDQSNDLKDFLTEVSEEEQRRQVKQKRESQQNLLIKKWDELLQEEFQLLEKKKRISNYNNFEIDEFGRNLVITVDTINDALEKGDYIQMSSKSGQQITVGTLTEMHENKVSVVLKWDVDISQLSTRGFLGIDIIQARASLNRLRRAIRAIKLKETENPNLPDIISDPQILTMNKVSPISSFFQDNLDPSNRRAVEKALSTKDLFLIQGPPGTGKTTVITEIVCQILKENPNAQILLTSQSHVAVDHAVKNIRKNMPGKRIIRVGRIDKVSEESESLLMGNQLAKWVQDVEVKSKNELVSYLRRTFNIRQTEEEKILDLWNSKIEDEPEVENDFINVRTKKLYRIAKVTREWHRRLGKLDDFDEIFARRASLVAATCLGIASRHCLNNMSFDWVIVDEAGRATPPELLVPIIRGKKIILVGDHKQLPPVVTTELEKYKLKEIGLKKSDLEKSLFEELINKIPPEAKTILTAQFRMHPTIAALISNVFYPAEGILTKTDPEKKRHYMSWWPKTVIWLNTQKYPNNQETDASPSKRNYVEAQVIKKTLEYIKECYENAGEGSISIGVISGYDAQKSLLSNLISPGNVNKWGNLKIVIDNVDAFQGSETDIAIYSLVRCNDKNEIGFLYDSRRLNVALSRGRSCLIVVGNALFAAKAQSYAGNPFLNILEYIKRNPAGCLLEDA